MYPSSLNESLDNKDDRLSTQESQAPAPRSTRNRNILIGLGIFLLLVVVAAVGGYFGVKAKGKTLPSLLGQGAAEVTPTTTTAAASAEPTSTAVVEASSVEGDSSSTQAAVASSSGDASTSQASTTAILLAASASQKASKASFSSSPSSSTSSLPTTSTPQTGTTASSQPSSSAAASAAATTSSSSTSTAPSSGSFWTQTYSGVATHFPGSQTSSSALACGDVYPSPATTLFAALCHTTYDAAPLTPTPVNENRSPVCGPFAAGERSLTADGAVLVEGDGTNYVIVGGDGLMNCVGTEDVRCHPKPLTIAVTCECSFFLSFSVSCDGPDFDFFGTDGGKKVSGVMIVDRNQGLGTSPCAAGDVDVSDLVYLSLSGGSVLGSELQDVTWAWET